VGGGQLSRGRMRHETRAESTDDRDDHPKSATRKQQCCADDCYLFGVSL
jgi:hypothetical protein